MSLRRLRGSRAGPVRTDSWLFGTEVLSRPFVLRKYGVVMSRPSGLLVLVVFSLFLAGRPASAQGDAALAPDTLTAAEQAARAAAQDWLGDVDAGAWDAAWEATAPGLRDTVAQEQWRTQRTPSRGALGTARSRRLVTSTFRDSLRRAPNAGPFVRLRYHSTFGPELYVETVLVENTDDAWQVAGYEVGPVTGQPERRPSSK